MKNIDQVIEEFKKERPNFESHVTGQLAVLEQKVVTELPELRQQLNDMIREYNRHFDQLYDINLLACAGTFALGVGTAVAGLLGQDVSLLVGGILGGAGGPFVSHTVLTYVGRYYEQRYDITKSREKITQEIDRIENQYALYSVFKKMLENKTLSEHEIFVLRKMEEKEIHYDYRVLTFINQYIRALEVRKQRQQELVQQIYQLEQTQHYDQMLDHVEDAIKRKKFVL